MRQILLLLITLLLVSACSGPQQSLESSPLTGLQGTIRNSEGKPVPGATVYAYRNARSGLRGPADFAVESDRQGRYLLDLAPGSYHLIARLRSGGSDSGPPRPGDAWALPGSNPVTLEENRLQRLDFIMQQVQSRQIVGNTLTSAPYSFRGLVSAPDGKALPGAVVLAYRKPGLHRRPDFASSPTGGDGRFLINLPDPGPWCLVFRQHTRGQLRRGELHALLGQEQSSCSLEASPQTDIGQALLVPFKGQ